MKKQKRSRIPELALLSHEDMGAIVRDRLADIIIMAKPASLGMRAGVLLQTLAGIEE
jgi:hypothetical protein